MANMFYSQPPPSTQDTACTGEVTPSTCVIGSTQYRIPGLILKSNTSPSRTNYSFTQEAVEQLDSLSTMDQLHKLWTSRVLCDVTLICENRQRLRVHRIILAANSKIFYDLVTTNNKKSYLFETVPLSIMQMVVSYMYGGVLYLSDNTVQRIADVADQLKVDKLVDVCHAYIEKHAVNRQLRQMDIEENSYIEQSVKAEVYNSPQFGSEPIKAEICNDGDSTLHPEYEQVGEEMNSNVSHIISGLKQDTENNGHEAASSPTINQLDMWESCKKKDKLNDNYRPSTITTSTGDRVSTTEQNSSSSSGSLLKLNVRKPKTMKIEDDCQYKPFSCTICSRTFRYHSIMSLHQRRIHQVCRYHFMYTSTGRMLKRTVGFEMQRCCRKRHIEKRDQMHLGNKRKLQSEAVIKDKGYIEVQNEVKTPFQCHKCKQYLKYKQSLDRHWKKPCAYENPNKAIYRQSNYKCGQCHKAYTSERKLCLHHYRKRHGIYGQKTLDSTYQCDFSGYTDVKSDTLHIHHNKVHGIKRGEKSIRPQDHQCQHCSRAYKKEAGLRSHEQKAHGIGSGGMKRTQCFTCDICKKAYKNQSTLLTHKQKSHGVEPSERTSRPYQCECCNMSYNEKNGLIRHYQHVHGINKQPELNNGKQLRILHNNLRAQCGECFKFLLEKDLRFHEAQAHSIGPTFTQSISCSKCSIVNRFKAVYKHHMQDDHNVRVQYCPKDGCDQLFEEADTEPVLLEHHLIEQHAESQQKCPMCDYKTVFWKDIFRHMMASHKVIQCPVCCKSFTKKKQHNMWLHMKEVHKRSFDWEQTYCEAPGCGYRNYFKFLVQKHIESHHVERIAVTCPICGQTKKDQK